jgi:chemotaxis methyl-accepting protein methylase
MGMTAIETRRGPAQKDLKSLHKVLAHVYRVTGFKAREYRPTTLQRRLNLRLQMTGSKNNEEYLAFLKKNPSECYRSSENFLVNVTEFFRDREIFNHLKRKILPDLLTKVEAEKKKRLRIWSMACSKGQEPYSLAIILDEISAGKKRNVEISILATDVSRSVLRQAKRGCYKKTEMNNIPKKYLKRYFIKLENDEFRMSERIRKMVRFKFHDLIGGNSLGTFHLILCRNLLIFVTARQQSRMFKKIHRSLKKEGLLVLGKSETPKDARLFHRLSSQNCIYQKIRQAEA